MDLFPDHVLSRAPHVPRRREHSSFESTTEWIVEVVLQYAALEIPEAGGEWSAIETREIVEGISLEIGCCRCRCGRCCRQVLFMR